MVGEVASADEPTFTLVAPADGEEGLRRTASAALAVASGGRNVSLQMTVMAMLMIGVGFAGFAMNGLELPGVAGSVVLVVAGLVLWFRFGRPGALEAGVVKRLRRDPFAGAAVTYRLGPAGLRAQAEPSDVWWSWRHLDTVHDHDGSLLLVMAGGVRFHLLPPSAFADEEQRGIVARWIEHWGRESRAGRGAPAGVAEPTPVPPSDEVFVLEAEGRRDEYLQRLGVAVLAARPPWRRPDVLYSTVCAGIVVVGIVLTASNVWNVGVIAIGLVAWLVAGRPSAAAKLLTRRLRADPVAHSAATYGLGPSGIRRLADGYDFRLAWPTFSSAREHDGSIVLAMPDGSQHLLIPPWSFTDATQRQQVLRSIQTWLPLSHK